jgi:predicted ester cyclase
MSDNHTQLVHRALRVVETGDVAAAEEVTHPQFRNHAAADDRPEGPEGFRQTIAILNAAWDDLRLEPLETVAEGDRVAVRLRFSGRHVGRFAGMEPTGREVSVEHAHFFRVVDGLIVEHRVIRDDVSAMRQLGQVPDARPV